MTRTLQQVGIEAQRLQALHLGPLRAKGACKEETIGCKQPLWMVEVSDFTQQQHAEHQTHQAPVKLLLLRLRVLS